MSVYVDPLITWGGDEAPRCFRHKPSCHMYADSLDELHAMAHHIGLRREWFQDTRHLQHYDLTPSKRVLAVARGAIEQDRRAEVEKWRELRALRRAA
jgi:hypothetical protein